MKPKAQMTGKAICWFRYVKALQRGYSIGRLRKLLQDYYRAK